MSVSLFFWGVLLLYWIINVEKLKEKAVVNFLASCKVSGSTLRKDGYGTEYIKLDIHIYLCSIHNFKDNCTQISQVTNTSVKNIDSCEIWLSFRMWRLSFKNILLFIQCSQLYANKRPTRDIYKCLKQSVNPQTYAWASFVICDLNPLPF